MPLAEVDLVTSIVIRILEYVEDRQDLAVVWHECFANGVVALDQLLEHHDGDAHDAVIARVEGVLDRNDELGDDGKDLTTAVMEEVFDALDGKEAIGLLLLADAVEENGQVVLVIKLVDVYFPADDVFHALVVDGDREVAALIEVTELCVGGILSLLKRACFRWCGGGHLFL